MCGTAHTSRDQRTTAGTGSLFPPGEFQGVARLPAFTHFTSHQPSHVFLKSVLFCLVQMKVIKQEENTEKDHMALPISFNNIQINRII